MMIERSKYVKWLLLGVGGTKGETVDFPQERLSFNLNGPGSQAIFIYVLSEHLIAFNQDT